MTGTLDLNVLAPTFSLRASRFRFMAAVDVVLLASFDVMGLIGLEDAPLLTLES